MFNDEIGAVLFVVRLLSVIGLLVACGGSLAGGLAVESAAPGMRWLRMADPGSPDVIAAISPESVAGRHFEIYLDYRSQFADDAAWTANNGVAQRMTPSRARAKGVVDRSCVRSRPVLLLPARGVDP